MDIKKIFISSILKAITDNFHIFIIIILIFILIAIISILKFKYEHKFEKKLRFLYLSKTDPKRYESEIKIDKNICPECNSELIIKYDRFGRFKKCINPKCEFTCKLKLN